MHTVSNSEQSSMMGTPSLSRLVNLLEAGGDSLTDISNIDDAFDCLVNSTDYTFDLMRSLRSLSGNSKVEFERLAGNAFALYQNARFSLTIQILTKRNLRGAKMLATSPDGGLQAVVSPDSSVAFARYRLPEGTDLSVFDPATKLDYVDRVELRSFGPSYRYYRGDVLDPHHDADVCLLRLREMRALDYQWSFDGDNLAPLFSSVTLPSVGRYETLIDLVVEYSGTKMDVDIAISVLKNLTTHRLHFIRWKAVQGLGQVDASVALGTLSDMRDDPHPHIRASASAVYDQIQGEGES